MNVRASRAQWLALGAMLLGACHSSTSVHDAGHSCPIGQLDEPPELTIVHQGTDGTVILTEEGDSVPLILPPQGGHIVVIGARARNVDACNLKLSALLRDPCNNQIEATNERLVTLEAQSDGWATPAAPSTLSNYSNLPVCPNPMETHPIQGSRYLLTITVEDSSHRTATASRHIVPVCTGSGPDHTYCLCDCQNDFPPNASCPPDFDAGVRTSSCGLEVGGAG